MKKHSLILLLCFTFVLNKGYSQFSVRAGINSSNEKYSAEGNSISFSSKLGFHVGIMTHAKLSEKLSFRPGLLYSQRGSKIELFQTEVTHNLNYLDIPLSFTYHVKSQDNGLFIEFGPNIQYLLSATATAEGETEDVKDGQNNLDLGVIIGTGYNINERFGIGFNYNLGLLSNAKEIDDIDSVKNTNLSLYLTYSF
ncbi:MAG: PorT family protein [Saprospiraceae bacterium]|nr:PorT family protein [Saprospiraceae bacterium]